MQIPDRLKSSQVKSSESETDKNRQRDVSDQSPYQVARTPFYLGLLLEVGFKVGAVKGC